MQSDVSSRALSAPTFWWNHASSFEMCTCRAVHPSVKHENHFVRKSWPTFCRLILHVPSRVVCGRCSGWNSCHSNCTCTVLHSCGFLRRSEAKALYLKDNQTCTYACERSACSVAWNSSCSFRTCTWIFGLQNVERYQLSSWPNLMIYRPSSEWTLMWPMYVCFWTREWNLRKHFTTKLTSLTFE